MRKLICFLIILLPLSFYAQNSTISGNAHFFKNEKIEVFSTTNNLSKTKHILQSDTIDDNGDYALTFQLSKPQVVIIKIEMREIYFRIHPNTNVQINFLPFKNASNQRNPLKLSISYSNIPQNTAADSVYHILSSNFANEQQEISLSISKLELYNSFFSKTDSVYQNYLEHDTLFNIYYTYFKANAMLQTSESRLSLISKYITDNNVIYESDQYLTFFKRTVSTRVGSYFYKNPKQLEKAKEEFQIYNSLLKALSNDSILSTKEIRSLALLLYVKEVSLNPILTQETKNAIINQCGNFSEFKIQREAAKSIEKTQNTLGNNMEAPLFTLNQRNDNSISLQSLRGKPVYLVFIHSRSQTCQKDLIALKSLQKKFRKMQFLIIVSDRDSILMDLIPKETNHLKIVYLNKEYNVLEKYQIWSFPVYFLIDKHGYFIRSPAKKPIEMFDTFTIMFSPKSKRKSYEIINDY